MPNKLECESIAKRDLKMGANQGYRDYVKGDLTRILKQSSLSTEAVQILLAQIQGDKKGPKTDTK